MMFLVVENHTVKEYDYTKVYTLGVFSSKEAAEERIRNESNKIYETKHTKGNLYIIELEMNEDCFEDLTIL